MRFDDINKQFEGIIKINDLLGKSLRSVVPDYSTALASFTGMSDLLGKSLRDVVPDYGATLGSFTKTNDLLGKSLRSVLPDYDAALGNFTKMNDLLGVSLKSVMPDYSETFGNLAKVNDLLGQSLKGAMPDYSATLGSLAKVNDLLGQSLKDAMPDCSNLFRDMNAIIGALKGFGFEDTFLSREYIDSYCEEIGIEDEEDKTEIQAFVEDLSIGKNIDSNTLSDSQKKFFATYIYPLILMLIPLIFQSLTAQPTIVNNTSYVYSEKYYKTEVNNYYTIMQGFDEDILNINNLRFVSKSEIIVRKCADNTSSVVSKLPLGKVVMVVAKHKKWIEISWKDEHGNCFSGWVQNWKVSKFK